MAFPATYNINYYSGDTYQFVIAPKNSDGSFFDLTDYSAAMTISNSYPTIGTTWLATVEVDVGNNIIACTIPPDVGSLLAPSTTYYYDLEIVNEFDPVTVLQGTKVFTLIKGTISVTGDITNA